MKVKNNSVLWWEAIGHSNTLVLKTAYCSPYSKLKNRGGRPSILPRLPSRWAHWCFILLLLAVTRSDWFCTSDMRNNVLICQCPTCHCARIHTDIVRREHVFQNVHHEVSRLVLPNFTSSIHSGGDATSCVGSRCECLAICQAPHCWCGGA